MAQLNVTDFKYRHYHNSWSTWSTELNGGYAGEYEYVVAL
jgi:hypothetical protein